MSFERLEFSKKKIETHKETQMSNCEFKISLEDIKIDATCLCIPILA